MIAIALALFALLVAPIPVAHAVECRITQGTGGYWSWRLVNRPGGSKKCWYRGRPGLRKALLQWPSNTVRDEEAEASASASAAGPTLLAAEPAISVAAKPPEARFAADVFVARFDALHELEIFPFVSMAALSTAATRLVPQFETAKQPRPTQAPPPSFNGLIALVFGAGMLWIGAVIVARTG
jgi:hypothetical protein